MQDRRVKRSQFNEALSVCMPAVTHGKRTWSEEHLWINVSMPHTVKFLCVTYSL